MSIYIIYNIYITTQTGGFSKRVLNFLVIIETYTNTFLLLRCTHTKINQAVILQIYVPSQELGLAKETYLPARRNSFLKNILFSEFIHIHRK